MKRRRAREYALQMLFQHEFTGSEPDYQAFWQDKNEAQDVSDYANSIVKGTLLKLAEIDEMITKAAEHWSLERMASVDRNILRFAAYELAYRKDIPPAVAINEAIEIAKKFSSLESAAFINGILDKLKKHLRPA